MKPKARTARGVTALLLGLGLSLPAQGQSLEEAVSAHDRGDVEAARQIFRALAARGDASTRFKPGLFHGQGRGVPQDDRQAVAWYRRAAEQGVASAQYQLGLIYGTGWAVARNDREAVKWWREAARQGVAKAQLNLGLMYRSGRGVARAEVQAYTWLSRAVAGLSPGKERDQALKYRALVEGQMTPGQLAVARRLARAWRAR